MNSKTEKVTELKPKVSLEQLIKKKLEKDNKRAATKEIYVESLGGTITANNPSDAARVEYSDKAKTGSYTDMIDGMVKLIYDCCPVLHSKELQESIGAGYPYDTVRLIFDIDEITDIGLKLINFFEEETEDNEEDAIKN